MNFAYVLLFILLILTIAFLFILSNFNYFGSKYGGVNKLKNKKMNDSNKVKAVKEKEMNLVSQPRWNEFKVSRELVKYIKTVPQYHQYELRKILERYLIYISQTDADPLVATNTLKSELLAKGMRYYPNIERILKMKFITPAGAKLVVSENGENVNFKYGDNEVGFTTKPRYQILRKLGTDEEILLSLMRYESLLPSGQQWAVPINEYRRYVKDYDVTVEGFASPFNSQLLRLADEFPDNSFQFCSLFPELDQPFGSIGNFFTQSDFQGKSVVVNPPFIEDILKRAAEKCINVLETGPGKFIFIGPAWTDAVFYTALAKSKYLVSSRHFKTHYENHLGQEIKSTFESVEFILERKVEK